MKFTKEEKTAAIFILACLFVGITVLYVKPSTTVPTGAVVRMTTAPVNINTATARELLEIKHVGPMLAGRIISYRKKNGPFLEKEDLKNVKGIGEKTYEKIRAGIALE